jgi:hypothetical protein
MFHACGVKSRPPAALVILSQLEIVALAVHPLGAALVAGPGRRARTEMDEERGRWPEEEGV